MLVLIAICPIQVAFKETVLLAMAITIKFIQWTIITNRGNRSSNKICSSLRKLFLKNQQSKYQTEDIHCTFQNKNKSNLAKLVNEKEDSQSAKISKSKMSLNSLNL